MAIPLQIVSYFCEINPENGRKQSKYPDNLNDEHRKLYKIVFALRNFSEQFLY